MNIYDFSQFVFCFPHFSSAFCLPCLLLVTSARILALCRHVWTCADIDPRRRRALPQCRFESRWGTRGQSEDRTGSAYHIRPHGTTWDHMGPKKTMEYLGHHGTAMNESMKRARITDASETRENIEYCTTKSMNRWGRRKGTETEKTVSSRDRWRQRDQMSLFVVRRHLIVLLVLSCHVANSINSILQVA